MASALKTQLDQPGTYEGLAFAERLQLLVDHEDQERNQRKHSNSHYGQNLLSFSFRGSKRFDFPVYKTSLPA
jgi:hypothetical protein